MLKKYIENENIKNFLLIICFIIIGKIIDVPNSSSKEKICYDSGKKFVLTNYKSQGIMIIDLDTNKQFKEQFCN